MSDFLPILLVALFWIFFGSSARNAKRKAQDRQRTPVRGKDRRTPAAESAGSVSAAASGSISEPAAAPAGSLSGSGSVTHSHAEPYRGSLGATTGEGTDPCHDDPYAMPSGSLRTDLPEGTDPCHDEPYAMPSGSLRTDLPEGTDPCHPGGADAFRQGAEKAGEAETSGLNLNISGDEIVRGFVWGEILNRKRA